MSNWREFWSKQHWLSAIYVNLLPCDGCERLPIWYNSNDIFVFFAGHSRLSNATGNSVSSDRRVLCFVMNFTVFTFFILLCRRRYLNNI